MCLRVHSQVGKIDNTITEIQYSKSDENNVIFKIFLDFSNVDLYIVNIS